ncbi:unnamed protein product, partial [Polarella glacialis]
VCGSPRQCRLETWLALQRFQTAGQIRQLGVSNFGPRQMQEIIALGGSPVTVNQMEYHPWVTKVHRDTVQWCHEHGVAVTAYGSMGSGNYAPQILAQDVLKQIGASHGKTVGQDVLKQIGASHGKTVGQVSVIPGTSNPVHQTENLQIFDFKLAPDQLGFLDSIPEEQHMLFFGHVPDEAP